MTMKPLITDTLLNTQKYFNENNGKTVRASDMAIEIGKMPRITPNELIKKALLDNPKITNDPIVYYMEMLVAQGKIGPGEIISMRDSLSKTNNWSESEENLEKYMDIAVAGYVYKAITTAIGETIIDITEQNNTKIVSRLFKM